MSVRRLAEENVQPADFAFSAAMAPEVEKWIGKYPEGRQQSAVIPLLMLAQEQEGWVSRAAIEHVAAKLDMPKIRVLEVATFYTQFMLAPVGTRAHVQVCGTTPCMLRGAEDLKKVCQHRIHHDPLTPNAEGTLSWEEVECAGACVNAPMVTIGKDTYEDLTPERLEEIINAFEAGKGDTIPVGPQIDRVFSAPVGGPVTLLDGEKVGSTVKVAATAKAVEPKEKPVEASVEGGNATMKVAATASGRAKKAEEEAAEPSLDDANRPAGIEKPETPDDLKLISGVGPKIEGTLNSLGIYTFGQIAGWTAAEREWVDGYLKFKGRIDRDDWVKQAEALSKGVDEYIRVFGKEPR